MWEAAKSVAACCRIRKLICRQHTRHCGGLLWGVQRQLCRILPSECKPQMVQSLGSGKRRGGNGLFGKLSQLFSSVSKDQPQHLFPLLLFPWLKQHTLGSYGTNWYITFVNLSVLIVNHWLKLGCCPNKTFAQSYLFLKYLKSTVSTKYLSTLTSTYGICVLFSMYKEEEAEKTKLSLIWHLRDSGTPEMWWCS